MSTWNETGEWIFTDEAEDWLINRAMHAPTGEPGYGYQAPHSDGGDATRYRENVEGMYSVRWDNCESTPAHTTCSHVRAMRSDVPDSLWRRIISSKSSAHSDANDRQRTIAQLEKLGLTPVW